MRTTARRLLACVAAAALGGEGAPAWGQELEQRRPEPAPAEKPAPKLTKPPVLKTAPEPEYPPEALAEGLAGQVTLLVDIDATGQVTGVQVARPAGHGFDEAAMAAAREMEFEPAEIDGQPAAIRIEYTMHFVPKTAPAPPPPPLEPPPAEAAPAPELPVVLRGRYREKGTRDPIARADVAVIRRAPDQRADASAEVVTTTGDDGRFEVRGAAPGGLRVIVSDSEHEPCIRDFSAAELAGATPPDITCTSAVRGGGAYETRVRAPRDTAQVTRHSLSQAELTTVPGTFGDPLRVVQNLPGVARIPYGIGQLIIRGANPQDSGVFVNGQRVPILYHFLGGPSVLTPNLLERIDFFPGGFSSRYGRLTAGIIDVTTQTEPARRVHGAANINLLDSSAYVEGPLFAGVSGALAGRRSYVDLLIPFFIPEQSGSTTVVASPYYWDYQGRLDRDVGRAGRVSLFVFGSNDELHVTAGDPGRGDIELGTRIGFHRVIGTWAVTKGAWVSRLSPSYGYDLARFGAGRIGLDTDQHVLALREDLTRIVSPRLKLNVGLDNELRLLTFFYSGPVSTRIRTYAAATSPEGRLTRELANLGLAAYAEALWDVGRVRLIPGARVDYFHYNRTDRASVDPRLVVRWSQTDRLVWKAGVGLFHQPQEVQVLDAEYGNPRLPLIWADQYHLGAERRFTQALRLDATIYFVRRHNLAAPSTREIFDASGRGRSYGLEVILRHDITRHFYGWLAYTLSRSEQSTGLVGGSSGVVGTQSPTAATRTFTPTPFDQTHNLIAVASYRRGAWEVGSRFRLVTGIPETPIVGGYYDADIGAYRAIQGGTFSARRQTFHQLDLRVERTWTFDTWSFGAYLDVQNVYDAQNPEGTIYDYRYRESAPIRGLPILPVIGLRGRL